MIELVEEDQLDLFFRARPYSLLAMTSVASLLYALLLPSSNLLLHLWFVSIILVDIFCYLTVLMYRKEKYARSINSKSIEKRLYTGSIISACLWGSAGIVFFPGASQHEQMFIFGTMVAVAAGSTIAVYFLYQMSAIFTSVILLALIAGVILADGFTIVDTLIIVSMITVYLFFMLKSLHDRYLHNGEVLVLRKTALEHERMLFNQREAAENANTAKSQFLANMSHDLRTPMHAILGFSELGSRSAGLTPVDKLTSYFVNINQSGKRLLRLLDNILDISKLEAGKMPLRLEEHDMKTVIARVVEDLAPLFSEREIKIEIDVTPLDTNASFDEDRIMQVIHNLLSNALRFAPADSVIKLKCHHTDIKPHINTIEKYKMPVPALYLSVSDQGAGILAGELKDVFNKFVQSSNAENNHGGTGLGLSICKEIVEIHGGTIKAENNRNGGALFSFVIPLQQNNMNAITAREAA